MAKNAKKRPIFRPNKAKNEVDYRGLWTPKKALLGPKNAVFSHFWAPHAQISGKMTPQRGSKNPVFGHFSSGPRGVPRVWRKRASNNGNFEGRLSVKTRKRAPKIRIFGVFTEKPQKCSFFSQKWLLSSNKHKEIAFAPYGYSKFFGVLRNAMDSGG